MTGEVVDYYEKDISDDIIIIKNEIEEKYMQYIEIYCSREKQESVNTGARISVHCVQHEGVIGQIALKAKEITQINSD